VVELVRYVKTRMEFQIPMHPHWHHIIENVSPINGAVRRQLHDLLGGYLDLPDAEDASYWCLPTPTANRYNRVCV
jgi:hypothetical protein